MSQTVNIPRAPVGVEETPKFLDILMNFLKRPQHDMMGLSDGVAAPDTKAGMAQMYVDTADGDLKIKFGDGTVKTIVVDT